MTTVAAQLAALTGLAQRLEEVGPPALRALDEHLSELDGMASGSDGAVVSTSLGSSVVERTAEQLATGRYTRDQEQIVEGIKEIAARLHHVLRVAGKYVPKVEHPRCNRGVGRDHVIEWGDPLCENYAAEDRGGMCDACAKREYRYRRDRGMVPRNVRGAA